VMAGAAARQFVQIGVSEIALAAADAPLFLIKDSHTGRFNLIALLGLTEPRNLFWYAGGMQATYLPRAASLTAFRLDRDGVAGVALDEADPGLGPQGEALFAPDQSPTPFIETTRVALESVISDVAAAQVLVDHYADHRLIRPLSLLLRYDDDHEHAVTGLYGIDEDALASLDDVTVVAMHRADRLAPAAVIAASHAQVERLRQLHNAAASRRITAFTLALA